MIDNTELATGLVVAMVLEMRIALARMQARVRSNDARDKNVLQRVSLLELRLRPLTDRIRKVVAQQTMKRATVLMLCIGSLFLASCAGDRGSLPPGHHSPAPGYGSDLSGTLVWLDALCILGAGLCAAGAFFGAVPAFTKIMWAGAAGFLASLAVSLFVGALIPAMPWIVGAITVIGVLVLGGYIYVHGADLWKRFEGRAKQEAAVVAKAA